MISHEHRTVFVHVPKCGGQSIERAFLSDLGLDWDARGALTLRENDDPARGPRHLAHLRAVDYVRLGHMTSEQFDAYYKFAVVRCPIDRAVSLYNYLDLGLSLDGFFLEWLPSLLGSGRLPVHVRVLGRSGSLFVSPQVTFLEEPPGQRRVDEVVRLEELDTRLPDIRGRSGLRSPIGHANRSRGRARRNDLDPLHLRVIEDLYAVDFERLGYAVSGLAPAWSDALRDEHGRRRAAARQQMIRNARVIRVRRAIRDPAAALRRLAGRAARVAR